MVVFFDEDPRLEALLPAVDLMVRHVDEAEAAITCTEVVVVGEEEEDDRLFGVEAEVDGVDSLEETVATEATPPTTMITATHPLINLTLTVSVVVLASRLVMILAPDHQFQKIFQGMWEEVDRYHRENDLHEVWPIAVMEVAVHPRILRRRRTALLPLLLLLLLLLPEGRTDPLQPKTQTLGEASVTHNNKMINHNWKREKILVLQ